MPKIISDRVLTLCGNMIIISEWEAVGFSWAILRDKYKRWFYLQRDGLIVSEGEDKKALQVLGWY